jgi:FAD/FMN-containing dehydrogenase
MGTKADRCNKRDGGNRDAHYIGGFAATWPPGAPSDPHVAWARDGWERIRPFSTGGNYVNFQLADDDTARTAAAYGNNYRRLQRAKATYDPDNLFRVNRNIPRRRDSRPDRLRPEEHKGARSQRG